MIELACEVKDIITGFKGFVVARYEFLNGCIRYEVQPKIKKDGTLPKSETIDELQLEIIGKAKILSKPTPKPRSREKGGPAPYLPSKRPNPQIRR